MQRLAVQRSLAGDHEPGPGEMIGEAHEVEDELDAGLQLGPERRNGGEAHPA